MELQEELDIRGIHISDNQHCGKGYGYEYICLTCNKWGCDHCHLSRNCGFCGYMSCYNVRVSTPEKNPPRCYFCSKTDEKASWNMKGLFCYHCNHFICDDNNCAEKLEAYKSKVLNAGISSLLPPSDYKSDTERQSRKSCTGIISTS